MENIRHSSTGNRSPGSHYLSTVRGSVTQDVRLSKTGRELRGVGSVRSPHHISSRVV